MLVLLCYVAAFFLNELPGVDCLEIEGNYAYCFRNFSTQRVSQKKNSACGKHLSKF